MSLAALAQEKFWENKAQCEDAEKAYYSRLSGAKVSFFCFFICFQTWVNFGLFAFFTYYPLFWSKIVSYFCYDNLLRVTFLSFFHHVYCVLKPSCRRTIFLWNFQSFEISPEVSNQFSKKGHRPIQHIRSNWFCFSSNFPFLGSFRPNYFIKPLNVSCFIWK